MKFSKLSNNNLFTIPFKFGGQIFKKINNTTSITLGGYGASNGEDRNEEITPLSDILENLNKEFKISNGVISEISNEK